MFVFQVVQAVDGGNQSAGRAFDVGISGVGPIYLALHVEFLDWHTKGARHRCHCAARLNIEVVRTNRDDLQVVRLEELLNRLFFFRGGAIAP